MVIQRQTSAVLSKDVLYIGSAVPLETSEGLEAVQQPLRSRYPLDGDHNVQGILSTLSILPSGIQLHYKNDPSHVVLFPFSGLTMCAAVRCVKTINDATREVSARFVSLSSPEAGGANSQQPAIFTAIMRRTKGRQVLECHGFITMTPKDALELVQITSTLDRQSKHGGLDTLRAGVSSSTYDVSRGDNSFYAETASLPEFPIQLVPGEPATTNTSPAFFQEPPRDGYFYSTRQDLVKKYSLHKFTGSAAVEGTNTIIPPGADHFQKRPGYPASHFSSSAVMYPTQPRHPMYVPVRPFHPQPIPHPTFMRPVFVGAPPPPTMLAYPRPRFFSPPPMVRVRPVPVLVPPPAPSVSEERQARAHLRRGSSRSSSASSAPDWHRPSSRLHGNTHLSHAPDDTSESTSRPRTPPTDYESPRGPRVSRRDDFYLRQNIARDLPRSPRPVSGHGYQGYYVLPSYGYYGHPPGLDRPRSVPPYVERTGTKPKSRKAKTKKKERKKKITKKGSHDESTDSVGYMSGQTADNKQPRDFRRPENQFKHERAFSKSLAEETRHSLRGSAAFNAYSLNNTTGNTENEFPPSMY